MDYYTVGSPLIAGYFLALSRMAGFVVTAPPFNTRSFPSQIKAGLVIAMAIPLSTWTIPNAPALDSDDLVTGAIMQLVVGAGLGMLVQFAVSAIEIVGDFIDTAGGFSITAALDPLNQNQSSVMGRLHSLIALTLLFIGNGHIIVLQALGRSFELMPGDNLNWGSLSRGLLSGFAQMFLAAIQIVAPILAALFLADLALGLLNRAAPALNAFSLAFPIKIALSLTMIGLVLTQIPGALSHLIDQAATGIVELSGG